MFVEVNHNREAQKAKYYLAKPNKDIIAHLYEKSNDDVSLKLGNTHELNFSIPFILDGESNEHIEMIKEKMLIKMVLGTQIEWFIIDEIQEDGNEEASLNIKCFSLGYELSHKRIGIYEETSVSLMEYSRVILDGTQWKLRLGGIKPKFEGLRRSISLSETNSLDALFQGAEAFGALIIWDTEKREISFEDLETFGNFKGMSINYGHLLNSLSKNRTTEELTTRLYIYGNEDLSIHGVNPTGQAYLEDFSYFLYPFQRDANRKVIKSSQFMSDELAHAILDFQELILRVTPESRRLLDLQAVCLSELAVVEQASFKLNLELESILTRLDAAKAVGNEALISTITAEKTNKDNEVATNKTLLATKKSNLANVNLQLENFHTTILTDSNFTPKLLDELNFYIIEKEWRDDRYIDAQELYDDGIKKFKEIRIPKVVLTVDVHNLFEMVEEQYYWNKLVLGDLIKIKYPQMNLEYMAKIMEINLDIEDGSISITIANAINMGDEFEDLLYKSSSASTLLQNNKHKWDKIASVEDEVLIFLNSEWDANKKKITAGVNNQIEIGKRGITITNPDNPNDVVIMQSGIIALSKTGGVDWKTAITPDGIIAERLAGNVIIGRNLIMTNENDSFTFDNDGFRVKSSKFLIESGTTSTTFDTIQSKIEQTAGKISLVVSETNKINAFAIASAISITPDAIDLISTDISLVSRGDEIVSSINLQPQGIKISGKNIEFSGFVTFGDFDTTTKNKLNGTETTVNGWKVIGKTTINGANIETGTISANKIKTEELIVGTNIAMGANAVISWGNVSSKPFIPSNANDIGALSTNSPMLTYIDNYGVYTGTIVANKITSGTISGINISGTTITGGTINGTTINGGTISVTTDVNVGNNLYLGSSNYVSEKSIIFASSASLTYRNDSMTLSSVGTVELYGGSVRIRASSLDLTTISGSINWGNHAPVAKFG